MKVRMPAVRKGWLLAGLLAVALVIAGAIVAAVDTVGTDDSGNEVASVSRDVAEPAPSSAGAAASDGFAGRAQVAPSPTRYSLLSFRSRPLLPLASSIPWPICISSRLAFS